jgi:ribosome biogenesis protein Nip4
VKGKPSFEEKMIRDLLKRKRAYEKYFRTLVKVEDGEEKIEVDNQAQSAYTAIIKTLFELSKKAVDKTHDPEEMRRLADEILESDYGIKIRE